MSECFEEGILQGYLDNELSIDMAGRVAAHVATCTRCAQALTAATDETLMLARAFEAEMALDVPTAILRERIHEAIARTITPSQIADQSPKRNLAGWLATLTEQFKLSHRRTLGFASLIVIVAFAAIVVMIQFKEPPTQIASNAVTTPTKDPVEARNPSNSNQGTPEVHKERGPERPKPKRKSNPTIVPEPDQMPKDELAAKPLPGEIDYLKAIDSLAVEIQSGGETSLRPSLRAEYERNLAVVDQAIESTRRVARRHRNDPDAAEFLYSSYQSKLDLLSAVAEQVRPTIATR